MIVGLADLCFEQGCNAVDGATQCLKDCIGGGSRRCSNGGGGGGGCCRRDGRRFFKRIGVVLARGGNLGTL